MREARARSGKALSKDEVYDILRESSAVFKAMNPEEQQRFVDAADGSRRQRKRRLQEEHEARSQKLETPFEERGLGLSSKRWPLDVAHASRTILRELGKDLGAPLPGVSAFWHSFRERFARGSYAHDEGDLCRYSWGPALLL